jgi:CheY-like chemotaxis protein
LISEALAAERFDLDAAPFDLRVLVVDDNAVNVLIATTMLDAAGARVDGASGGREAIEKLSAEAFDLVLLDLHMPEVDGAAVAAAVRGGRTRSSEVPLIAMTGDAMAGQGERLLALGFDGLLAKPFTPADLLTAIAGLRRQA